MKDLMLIKKSFVLCDKKMKVKKGDEAFVERDKSASLKVQLI